VFAQLREIVDYTALVVWMIGKGGKLEMVEYQGPLPRENVFERWNRHYQLGDVDTPRLTEPQIIPDVLADEPVANEWRQGMLAEYGEIPTDLRTWMSIPLIFKDRPIGFISLHHREPNAYTARDAQLALALANHAAVSIENARLFQAVRRGADQFRAISEMGQHITSILDVDELLTQTVQLIRQAFGYYHVHIGLIDGDVVRLPASAGVWEAEPDCRHCASLDLSLGQEAICSRVASTGEPLLVPDISREPLYLHPLGATGSGVVVPLRVKGQVIGLLDVEHRQTNAFDEQDVAVLQLLANQVGVAIENARLFQTVQRGAEQFRAISEVGQRITSILEVDELFTQTIHLIQDTFGYFHVHIGLIEEDYVVFPAAAGVWENEPVCRYCADLRLRVGQEGACGWVAGSGEPLLLPDINQDPRYINVLPGGTGSGVVVPLKVKGQVIGVLDVESHQKNAFDQRDVAVMQLLANQVAVAIENARLYEKAQALAALQERQKLARELHDSVSQALYGLALGTRTARTLLDRDPAQAAEPLDYCLSLAEAGLAEMRALIFELRPESLETEGLVAALAKQAAAAQARHNLPVETALGPEPDAPLPVKETIYRIAQEALNNAVKHAGATQLRMSLDSSGGQLRLEIQDNGTGFDPAREYPGHLGLKSMRERAERLRGEFEIHSTPGRGTRIRVELPLEAPALEAAATYTVPEKKKDRLLGEKSRSMFFYVTG
jgi:signal transduction histidine kinase